MLATSLLTALIFMSADPLMVNVFSYFSPNWKCSLICLNTFSSVKGVVHYEQKVIESSKKTSGIVTILGTDNCWA